MKKNIMYQLISIILMTIILTSCAAPPKFVARNNKGPDLKYCNSSTGHKAGAIPFILGGTCTCTPTENQFKIYQSESSISGAMTYQEFLQLYISKGIKTDLDHKGCNNRCQWGPHIVFGGKCMVTPTPGTLNYERVISGIKALTTKDTDYEKLY